MQWSPKGAHFLLQMRTRVLNGELEQMFQKWYPGFRVESNEELKKAAYPPPVLHALHIRILDHIIIGGEEPVSFAEAGLLI